MATNEASVDQPRALAAPGGVGLRLAGALLFLPAVVCGAGTLAWPSVSTFLISLRESRALDLGDFVGLQHYLAVLGAPEAGAAAGFTLLLAFTRVAAVAVVPLLLALGLRGLGAAPRGLVRLAATVPTALYLPALVALAWLIAAHPTAGLLPQPAEGSWLASPARARLFLLMVDGVYGLCVGVAIGLAAYLAALRSRPEGGSPWGALLVVWAVGVLAALASGLQTLSPAFVLTRGGPANSTLTLALLQYNLAFVRFAFGEGAALAVLVLAALMVLGLLATVLVLVTRLRLAVAPASGAPKASQGSPLALIVGLLLFVPVWLAAVGIPAWVGVQAFGAQGGGPGPGATAPWLVLVNTLVPPALAVLLQVGVAWGAALGLSALRPLGRASEWLLLLFAPWLFVTLGPLSLADFMALRDAGNVNTFAGLIPPLRLSVPILFVLALFFKGQAARWQAQPAGAPWSSFARQVVVPSLPLAALLVVLGWLAGVQEMLWPLLAATSPAHHTASVAALMQAATFGRDPRVLAGTVTRLGLPLFVLWAFLLGLFQVTLLDRLVVATGDEVEAAGAAV